jgi:MFS family permease
VLAFFTLTLIAFVAFIFWERRTPYPMLDLQLFASRRYAFSVVAATLQTLALFAMNFLLVFYLQGVRGYSPLTAAFLILPLSLMISICGPLGGRWADRDRFGGTTPVTVGLVLQSAALVMLITLTPTTSYVMLALILIVMGVGGALFWSPNTSTTMGAAPRNRLGVASATLSTMRNVGMACSFALALAVAAASMPPALVNAVFLGTVGHLQAATAFAFTSAMSHAFIASAIICVFAIFFSLLSVGKRSQATTGSVNTAESVSSEHSSEQAVSHDSA